MPVPACSKCGATTIYAGYNPWCPACGWHREEARRKLTVPVFYDAQNPSRRVLSRESLCEVILPGQP